MQISLTRPSDKDRPVRAAWGRGKVAWGGVGLSRVEYHGTDAQASLGRVGPVRAAWGRGKVAWGGVGLSRVEYHGTDAEASLTSGRRPSGVGGYGAGSPGEAVLPFLTFAKGEREPEREGCFDPRAGPAASPRTDSLLLLAASQLPAASRLVPAGNAPAFRTVLRQLGWAGQRSRRSRACAGDSPPLKALSCRFLSFCGRCKARAVARVCCARCGPSSHGVFFRKKACILDLSFKTGGLHIGRMGDVAEPKTGP